MDCFSIEIVKHELDDAIARCTIYGTQTHPVVQIKMETTMSNYPVQVVKIVKIVKMTLTKSCEQIEMFKQQLDVAK